MRIREHAEHELDLLPDINPGVRRCVMKLLDIMTSEGPSGGSAPYIRANICHAFRPVQAWACDDMSTDSMEVYVLATMGFYQWACRYERMWRNELRDEVVRLFDAVASYQALTPLTGADDEWIDHGHTLQNCRTSSILKMLDGAVYNVDGVIFVDDSGASFTCAASFVPVTFPYTPTPSIRVQLDANENAVDPEHQVHADRLRAWRAWRAWRGAPDDAPEIIFDLHQHLTAHDVIVGVLDVLDLCTEHEEGAGR